MNMEIRARTDQIRPAAWRALAIASALRVVLGHDQAQAQPQPRPAAPPDAPAETPGQDTGPPDAATGDAPSGAELAEIAGALGEDAAARAGAQPAAPPRGSAAAALQSLNPDISLVADVAVAYFSDAEHLQSGAHDPRETGFNLQQLEMSIGKAVDPYFRMDANLVFGELGVEIEEVYATTLALPWNLQARAGRFLTRVGRLNATHPHAWDFVDQP